MSKLNLMLHCGSALATREQVAGVVTPAPNERTGWTPVSHIFVADQLESALGHAGFEVSQTAYGLFGGGNRVFGMMELTNTDDGSSLVAGFRNSHDQSFAARLLIGEGVWLCDNLSWTAEFSVARKHTRFIYRDFPGRVAALMGRIHEARVEHKARKDAYKNIYLTEEMSDHLVVDAARKKILPGSKVVRVADEFLNPRHEEFSERNIWGLYNSFTEHLKGSLQALPQRTMKLHGLLDPVAGLTV